MDSLKHYRRIVQTTIEHYCHLSQNQPSSDRSQPPIAEHLIFDPERDRYLWLRSGWDGCKRVQHIILYIRLEGGKVWVETDNTDLCIVDELIAANIPEKDIVLGFHHPSQRALAEFSLGV